MQLDKAEILIAGAGIIGLTIARELVKAGYGDIVVIEKEPELGMPRLGPQQRRPPCRDLLFPRQPEGQVVPERQLPDARLLQGKGAPPAGERQGDRDPHGRVSCRCWTNSTAGPRPTAPRWR